MNNSFNFANLVENALMENEFSDSSKNDLAEK